MAGEGSYTHDLYFVAYGIKRRVADARASERSGVRASVTLNRVHSQYSGCSKPPHSGMYCIFHLPYS